VNRDSLRDGEDTPLVHEARPRAGIPSRRPGDAAAPEGRNRDMSARLISLDGSADIPLDRLIVVVGRHRGCDARLDSARVSRRHCCLALESDGLLVRDLGSTNGTWINGERIDVGELLPGDELSIAHLRYSLELRGGPPRTRRTARDESSRRAAPRIEQDTALGCLPPDWATRTRPGS